MKLIAWDTSSKQGAIAAVEWTPGQAVLKLVSEWTLNVEATHSERLLWAIDQTLQTAQWKLEEVDCFGVGVGPGSFTGLRIGLTTARTLAHALQKPVITVSSLAALARPAASWLAAEKRSSIIVATTDACKNELFALWGNAKAVNDCVVLAQDDLPGIWKRGVEEAVLSPEVLMKALSKKMGKSSRWLAVGEGRHRYPDAWASLPKEREIKPPLPFADGVQGRYVALLAWESFQSGVLKKPLQVFPRYLRASDAEMKLRAGLLPPGPTRK